MDKSTAENDPPPRHREGGAQRDRVMTWLRHIPGRTQWGALAMLATGLLVTLLASLGIKNDVEAIAQREFEFACNEIRLKIDDRLDAHARLLYSGAALFDSSGEVTREEWQTFTSRLQVEQHLPGIQGIGFAVLIPRDQLAQHVEQIRSQGFPEYQVRPAGQREIYSSIMYLEPFSGRNLRAFGYDMFSEPVRRAAMERARDENEAALSGKVFLVQETDHDVQAGTLMYVPVYRRDLPLETVEQRRAALWGWVYSPYRMTDLLSGILGSWASREGNQIHLQVYDGEQLSTESLLYDSLPTEGTGSTFTEHLALRTPVDSAGRRWILRCAQIGDMAATLNYVRVWLVLGGGTTISFLVAGLMFSLLTTRSRAQQIAEGLTTELRKSEEKYRTVADFTYDWEAWRAPDGAYLYVSPSCERITGHTVAEFMADADLVVQLAHPDDRSMVIDHFRAVAHDAKAQAVEFDFRVITASGETCWVSHSCTPVYGEGGQWLGRRESNRDITERKRQEQQVQTRTEELAAAVAELQRVGQMKDEFLAAVSHELRTPLTGVLTMAEVLEMQLNGSLNERQLHYVRTIYQSGKRLLALINSILHYTNLAAGNIKLQQQPCRLAELGANSVSAARAHAEQKGQTVAFTLAPADIEIISDADGISQTLQRLLDNAVKFTPAGGHIGLEVCKDAEDDTVRLTVWDTGIGITAEQQETVFQPFVQGDSSLARRFEGIGLGLAYVQRMVELLGGAITVESTPDQGSRFTVTLPVTPCPSKPPV